ncbi:unnamed protein product [Dovyalis caffra]|uniref:procollagen-proline 4-dioxygenase n=1 Tax=Dovyalis caffra TaxID=77055 RepID=A0AAV1RLJ9_9ROSI|nr:unnamed protein product [Dovyalis caffra]
MQIMHYGIEDGKHNFDYYGNKSVIISSEPLMATLVFYLSNVTRGGEIRFPKSEVESKIWSDCTKTSHALRPVKGNAILFFTVHPNTSPDTGSSHSRCPVLEGEMWYATKTFHSRAVKVLSDADRSECTDEDENCPSWAALGECEKNPVFMMSSVPTPENNPDRTRPRIRGPNLNGKVRVIAKIRGSPDLDGVSKSWISVTKRDGHASHSLTFGDQGVAASRKEAYEVDFCYDQTEKNDLVFEREVKPFINEVFDGRNATIIACGARGSGKSYLIQGTEDELGFAALAVAEMVQLAADSGKSIAVSFYEVDHDHVKDLLDPNRQQVIVLKDAQGKTRLKGLSQVPVTSVSEFQKLHGGESNSRKLIQKAVTELPKRSHKGLIVYVSSHGGEKLDNVPVSKLNFVDLAGYEDARRKGIDGNNLVESTRNINKSIHAIHNVVYSLKANETHVPYRESKITNMLQDSLGGACRILMNPSFCQDSIYMVKLASRSCQGTTRTIMDFTKQTTRTIMDSTKQTNGSARPMLVSSHKSRMLGSISSSVKKQTVSGMHISGKKANSTTSALKARKLFDEPSDLKSQKPSSSDNVSTVESSMQEEDQLTSDVAEETTSLEVEGVLSLPQDDANSVSVKNAHLKVSIPSQEVPTVTAVSSTCETTMLDKKNANLFPIPSQEASPAAAVSSTCETRMLDKKNANLFPIPSQEASPAAAVSSTCETRMLDKKNANLIPIPSQEASPVAISSTCEITILDKTEDDHNKIAPYTGELAAFDEGKKTDKENNSSIVNQGGSPPISAQLQELSKSLKLLCSSTPSCIEVTPKNDAFHVQTSTDIVEPTTPNTSMRVTNKDIKSFCSPWETFNTRSTGMKNSLVQDYLKVLNTADKEELKKLKGIGEKRATYILEIRQDSPEPFKNLDDLKDIGLSAKQVKTWLKKEVGGLFD